MRLRHWIFGALFFVEVIEVPSVWAAYSAGIFLDPVTSNLEHQFKLDGFHFATLLETPEASLGLRTRPDQFDENGWGTTWHQNPFLAFADPGYGVIDNIVVGSTGIDVVSHGLVARPGGLTFGTWEMEQAISYDPVAQRVFGAGSLDVELDDSLSVAGRDLNLERIASNFLNDVPLQTGGVGDTGDMREAFVKYAPGGDPMDFVWDPPSLPAHYPFYFSNFIELSLTGQINTVDTLALGEEFQIEIARKPTFTLTYTSGSEEMIAGMEWDADEGQDFSADNIGMNHLIIQGETASTVFSFSFQFESTTVPGLPGDFDLDNDIDVDDIDLLCDLIESSASNADLNGDTIVNQDDMDYMIATILGTAYGDADLDGDVDGADFDAWRLRDSLGGGIGWATGDFHCDGDVDGADFDLWRLRPAAIGGAGFAPVPEPAAWLLAGFALPVLLQMRRYRRSDS